MQHIGVNLEDENGNVIERFPINFANVIAVLWEENKLVSYPWLGGVDPYGLTIFNLNQTPHVIKELEKLQAESSDQSKKALIQDSIAALRKVEQHVYIKFVGD